MRTRDRQKPMTTSELDDVARTRPCRGTMSPRFYADLVNRMPAIRGATREWFVASLGDDQRKWVAAALLVAHPQSARSLVEKLLAAGMREANPSFNRAFVVPLRGHCTCDEAIAWLLKTAQTDAELGGAARLTYWLAIELGHESPTMRRRLNGWMIRSFLKAKNGYARRSLLAGISFDPADLSEADTRRCEQVVREASTSSDEYLRTRLQINQGIMQAIPPLLPPD